MAPRDKGTEQLIKDTAKRVFFAEGKLHATTQDIADAAGVTRTLLHYYFRSRDILLEKVFKEAMQDLTSRFDAVMESDMVFKDKIERLIEVYLADATQYPYQETFVVTEMIVDPSKYHSEDESKKLNKFLKDIKVQMELGNIKTTDPLHFAINLFSLLTYPLLMAPLHKQMFNLTDAKYDKFIKARKKVIMDLIF
jgi:TetR/AcrR family transcriptional regulator